MYEGRKEGRKKGNVLFNDALNTFYLQLYCVRHIAKDHSDSERGKPLPPQLYVYIYIFGSIPYVMYVFIYIDVRTCLCMHECMYTLMCACMHACMYVCIHECMYICVYICLYICMFACVRECMYAFIFL